MEVCNSHTQHLEGLHHWVHCEKNPGHRDFTFLKHLTVRDLPSQWRTQANLRLVRDLAKRTVRLRVAYTSNNRTDSDAFSALRGKLITRMGTGQVHADIKQLGACPIPKCTQGKKGHKVLFFNVTTAKHVIYDDVEALNTDMDFFYNCHGCWTHWRCMNKVVTAKGIKVLWTDMERDTSLVKCATHDLDLREKVYADRPMVVRGLGRKGRRSDVAVVISHAHGCQKQVTFGKVQHVVGMSMPKIYEENDGQTWFRRLAKVVLYDIPTCPGSSGAAIFSFKNDGNRLSVLTAIHSKCCGRLDDAKSKFGKAETLGGGKKGMYLQRDIFNTSFLGNLHVSSALQPNKGKHIGENLPWVGSGIIWRLFDLLASPFLYILWGSGEDQDATGDDDYEAEHPQQYESEQPED